MRPRADIESSPAAHTSEVHVFEVDLTSLDVLKKLNLEIFNEERIINTFERDDLLMLLATVDERPAGFKIGYRENRFVFYSAKGGVLPEFRRRGLATKMLYYMMDEARARGYLRFAYDTFPNKDQGMTILGLNEDFRVVKADFNKTYKDWRLRLEKRLVDK